MRRLLLTVAFAALALTWRPLPLLAVPEAEHRGHWVAPNQWQMNDIGRNHGVLGGPGIPKCNPWVSPECARLHPSLFNKVPRPR
jgi:hypothetical protein